MYVGNCEDLKKLAYSIVFDDLKECGLFCGKYDAKNGNKSFMYGVSTVMESIAYNICDEVGDDFSKTFIKNMVESQENT